MYGTSGGALTGCLLFLDIDLDALAEYVFICVAKARSSWRGKFLLREYCRGAIEQFCTRDAHKILQGRFEISITRIFQYKLSQATFSCMAQSQRDDLQTK